METEGLRARNPPASAKEKKGQQKKIAVQEHPGGAIKHGGWAQAFRMLAFGLYFNICIIS